MLPDYLAVGDDPNVRWQNVDRGSAGLFARGTNKECNSTSKTASRSGLACQSSWPDYLGSLRKGLSNGRPFRLSLGNFLILEVDMA